MNLLKRRNTLTPLLGLYARRDSLQDCGENIDLIMLSESKPSGVNLLGHQNQIVWVKFQETTKFDEAFNFIFSH